MALCCGLGEDPSLLHSVVDQNASISVHAKDRKEYQQGAQQLENAMTMNPIELQLTPSLKRFSSEASGTI